MSPSPEAGQGNQYIALGRPLATASTIVNVKRSGFLLVGSSMFIVERKPYQVLARFLIDFLENIAPEGYVEDWTWKHIMYMMAISVAQAIRDGRQLHLGGVCCGKGRSPYTAILVRDGVDWQNDKCDLRRIQHTVHVLEMRKGNCPRETSGEQLLIIRVSGNKSS